MLLAEVCRERRERYPNIRRHLRLEQARLLSVYVGLGVLYVQVVGDLAIVQAVFNAVAAVY